MIKLPGRKGSVIIAMEKDVEVERLGPDPFGRGELTVFYRDYNIDGGRQVFYLWASLWRQFYPNVSIPVEHGDA